MQPLETFIHAALRERYVAPVMRVDAGIVRVLAGKPLDLARERAAAAGYPDVEQRVVPLELAELSWFAVPAAGLRLWRQHGAADEAGELVTELLAGDPPVQLLTELDDWVLIRALDGATGWLTPHATAAPLEPTRAPGPGALEPRSVPGSELASHARGFLGVPYVWGGTSERGIDCSGLVQRAAWRAGGAWLPRHSTALLKVGARVGSARLGAGDILVLRRLPGTSVADPDQVLPPHGGPARHPMHVAVAVDEETVVHASRDAWQVIQEPVADLRTRYRVLSIRRLDGSAVHRGTREVLTGDNAQADG